MVAVDVLLGQLVAGRYGEPVEVLGTPVEEVPHHGTLVAEEWLHNILVVGGQHYGRQAEDSRRRGRVAKEWLQGLAEEDLFRISLVAGEFHLLKPSADGRRGELAAVVPHHKEFAVGHLHGRPV